VPLTQADRLDPIGSQRKKAAVTGSAYLAQAPKPFSKTSPGYIQVTTAKDRTGDMVKGSTAAIVAVRPLHTRIEWEVRAPADEEEEGLNIPPHVSMAGRAIAIVRDLGPKPRGHLLAELADLAAPEVAKRQGLDLALSRGWLIEGEARTLHLGAPMPPPSELLER